MTQTRVCETAGSNTRIGSPPDIPAGNANLAIWIRQPWMVRVDRQNVLLRGTSPRDLGAVAAMHTRCSAQAMLDRYRAGGRAPSSVAVERLLRRTLAFVACTARGDIVAMAVAVTDPAHAVRGADIGVLVEDQWQRRGLGRELITHLAGAAFVCGYSELIAYVGTSAVPAGRLLAEVGRTRAVLDGPCPHLHTVLSESTTLGLGAVRERLAG
jgi:GNAT superfamily N-acetyltransferase